MRERIRVGILEDQTVLRESLVALFEGSGMEVCASGGDVESLLAQMQDKPLDVAIVDLRLENPGNWAVDNGLRLVEVLRERYPHTRSIVFSAHREASLLERCFQAGAAGYLCKLNASGAALLSAVEQVARGESLVPPELVSLNPGASASPLERLTQREREVLELVAAGSDNLQISARLGITERTVKAHVSNLYRKMGVQNRVEMAMIAYQSGFARPPPPQQQQAEFPK
ncbi:putative two-component system response regulator [Cystobacter fuscus DSM 2262]|uniref:Two-component system response regulator n=1 Tax=Cystobacter fuscus (strain ATCC 25194 / DSM 2262 / NBRC 100088 / M29) TaxID=1242864 RepID=S9P6T1_CYSF2|nr:response regulator transcription factor [Cystobacter fuscus]EPX60130.1 putative two-component system response regulator [Cystobacter fuscus DSM 2262]